MPIKPENKHRYPEDWPLIRERVLTRAGHRCELCGAPDRKYIRRMKGLGSVWRHVSNVPAKMDDMFGAPIRVILTTAHLDHSYVDHDDKFLLALCQRCHLKIDVHMKVVGRRKAKAAA